MDHDDHDNLLGEPSGPSRREILRVMGASIALAGLGSINGCSDKPPDAKIVPRVNPAEAVIPGKPLFFATAMPMNGFGRGVLVASREGRPIKIEGNPDHPASLGATDAFTQASILTLYDPERAKVVTFGGNVTSWGEFWRVLRERLEPLRAQGGAGLRILSGVVTSPTLAAQHREFLTQFPNARWHTFDPLARDNTAAGLRAAFNRPLSMRYDLSRAKIILSLDSDFLFDEPGSIAYARHFADGRRVRRDHKEMNRLYIAESTLSITGSMADHRLALSPDKIAQLAAAIAVRVGVTVANASNDHAPWIVAVADDLIKHHGECAVIVGESQPPEVHAIGHALNHALGNIGKTVLYMEPIEAETADDAHSLAALVADMLAGDVQILLILGDNPAYTAPCDLNFREALTALSTKKNADGSLRNLTAHLTLHENETSFSCQWNLPESHYLEMWGDVRAFDGTASVIQPLIAPLYGTLSNHEVLESLLGRPDRTGYEIVRGYWQSQQKGGIDFETTWEQHLKKGVIEGSGFATTVPPAPIAPRSTSSATQGIHVVFRPDYTVWDGSFANNAWMQELPKPFTKLTWDNAALISPKLAKEHALSDGDVVKLVVNHHQVEAPVMILPGVPDDVVSVHFGYGRTRGGSVATIHEEEGQPKPRGFNAYAIRTRSALWFASGLQLTKTARQIKLVTTRSHHAMGDVAQGKLQPHAAVTEQTPPDERERANRRLVRIGTLDEFQRNPAFVKDLGGESEKKPLLSLYPGPENGGWDYSKGYQWGMSIDMSACIGCNACVVACQAENNIPVVGREEVERQREMHWIRIDSYFAGPPESPTIAHQPVPCMHCENAPCEYVCPTGATTHSTEGLNQMTYNRCVGTRYCSNNCPYKVRRFNFLAFADAETTPQRTLQRNPDVTVRARGVMEKCTYCIQRIQRTRIEVEKKLVELSEWARSAESDSEKDRIVAEAHQREFEMISRLETACQQACPTRAIVFGSINPVAGQKMEVAKLKDDPLNYSLLRELTTKPRTTYMARLRNPNPALEPQGGVA